MKTALMPAANGGMMRKLRAAGVDDSAAIAEVLSSQQWLVHRYIS